MLITGWDGNLVGLNKGEISMTNFKRTDFIITKVKTMGGMENTAFECNVLLRGAKIAYCRDDGWGGPLHIEWLTPQIQTEVEKFCAVQPALTIEGTTDTVDLDAEILFGELFSDWLQAQEDKKFARKLAKLAQSNTLFRLKGDAPDAWRNACAKVNGVFNSERTVAFLQQKYSDKIEQFYKA